MENLEKCLNCNENLIGKFCHSCSQISETHRLSIKHLLVHEILHGIWHFEKGLLFTIKEILLRPGKVALNFISGKRIKYYNFFYLLLLLIGANIYLVHLYNDFFPSSVIKAKTDTTEKVISFMTDNLKLILFSFVPLLAFNSSLLFKKKKFNYSEHIIIGSIILLGILTITALDKSIDFLNLVKFCDFFVTIKDYLIDSILLVFITLTYFQIFKSNYKPFSIILRTILVLLLFFIEFLILFGTLIYFFKKS